MVTISLLFTNDRDTSTKERENSPLSTVQHNACAMNILRSRFGSRINFIVSNKGDTEYYQELACMLELVQNLDEFITIMSNISSTIIEVRDDVEQTVEAAEASLSGLHDAISKMSTRLLPDLRQEIEPVLVSELSTVFAPGKINTANSMANEATVRGATEREEDGKGEQKEEAESMMA
jgi:hypothetical protein